MRPRARPDQLRRLLGAAALVSVAFFVVGPPVTGATLVASTGVTSEPIHAGTWSSGNAYPAAVTATTPAATDILRLAEQAPVTFVDDSGTRGATAVAAGTGLGWGASGLLLGDTDTALAFDGDASGTPYVRTGGVATTAPAAFTVAAWVDVTAGGRILGYGDASSGPSTNADRVLYVDDAGYLQAAIRDAGGVVASVRSDAPLVGATHHVAFSLGAAGLLLYVDGTLQASSDPSTTTASTYPGWWRIGWDSLPTDYPGLASADGLVTGTVDEVAVWDAQLTDPQVATLAAANHT